MDRSVMYIYFDLKNQSDVSTHVVFQREREREREREKQELGSNMLCYSSIETSKHTDF